MKTVSEDLAGILEGCPLFEGLDGPEIRRLLSASTARIRHYAKNELVAQEGEKVFFLNILISGSVKGEMTDETGKVIKIEDILPPRPLAPAFLFGQQNTYPVQITANESASLLSIPGDEFLKMMQGSEQVLRNFIHILSSRGQFLSSKIKFLTFSNLRAKLARYLLDLSAREGTDRFTLPLSQNGLSELFGVTRPSVGRAIGTLNQEGIIRTEGKAVTILDRNRLRTLLQNK
ncbi:MAG: Crp/Fnr family transcriptional regulator [Bacteroidales bacterium]